MMYKGGCHCGKIVFQVEGELKGANGMQLLDVFPQGVAHVVCAAR